MMVLFPFFAAATTGTDPLTVAGAPEINLFWQTLQVVLALGVTLALLIATVWMFKKILRFKQFPGISGGAIHVLEIHYIDPKKAIALVKVMDRVLILGYADSSITTLGELSDGEAARLTAVTAGPAPLPFGNVLARFMKGKGLSTVPGATESRDGQGV